MDNYMNYPSIIDIILLKGEGNYERETRFTIHSI